MSNSDDTSTAASEARELMAIIATLYAMLLEIDTLATDALHDGTSWEMDAALCKIRELIESIREDKKNGRDL